jgi:hypothetical protein
LQEPEWRATTAWFLAFPATSFQFIRQRDLLRVLRKRRGAMDGNWLGYSQTVAEMPHHPAFCTELPASGLVEAKTVCHRIGG